MCSHVLPRLHFPHWRRTRLRSHVKVPGWKVALELSIIIFQISYTRPKPFSKGWVRCSSALKWVSDYFTLTGRHLMSSLALCNQDIATEVTFDAASSVLFFTIRIMWAMRWWHWFISFDIVFRGFQTTPTLRNAVASAWASGEHVIRWHWRPWLIYACLNHDCIRVKLPGLHSPTTGLCNRGCQHEQGDWGNWEVAEG